MKIFPKNMKSDSLTFTLILQVIFLCFFLIYFTAYTSVITGYICSMRKYDMTVEKSCIKDGNLSFKFNVNYNYKPLYYIGSLKLACLD